MSDQHEITGAEIKATAPQRVTPAFEHRSLDDPTEPLEPLAEERDSLDRLLQSAARWAEIQGSDKVRLPHLFAALLGAGADARWDWLRKQKPDLEALKQKVLLMVPAQKYPQGSRDETTVSKSVRRVLDLAKRKAADDMRSSVSVKDVYAAFFADGGGAVGAQLKKWGVQVNEA